jgi:hypothetical protein
MFTTAYALNFPPEVVVVTRAIGRATNKLARMGYARSANGPSKSSSMEQQVAPFERRVNSVGNGPHPPLREAPQYRGGTRPRSTPGGLQGAGFEDLVVAVAARAGGQQDARAGPGVRFGVVMPEGNPQLAAHVRETGGTEAPD